MFLRCQTQWRAGASGVIGLDYNVVFKLCSLQQIQNPVELLDNLRVMEQHALERFRKTLEQQAKQQQRRR